MFQIKQGYTNVRGEQFPNIRNINFATKKDLSTNLGKFITETNHDCNFLDDDFPLEEGIFLYESNYDRKKALRIYKDFANYQYINHDDETIVSRLQENQKNVKLTEFPTGIITIENKVIGQETPYYKDYVPIISAFKGNKILQLPTEYYIKVLNILRELYQNGIIYSDVHGKNFLVGPDGKDVKIIDFDSTFLEFGQKKTGLYFNLVNNLKLLIYELNMAIGVNVQNDLKKASSLENIEECVNEIHHVLTKKR